MLVEQIQIAEDRVVVAVVATSPTAWAQETEPL